MSKLIKCKACGRDIARGAKVCPGCGKKQKMSFGKRLIVAIVGCAIIGAVWSGVGGSGSSTSTNDTSITYQVGSSFVADKLEITIISVQKMNVIAYSIEPSEGAVYLAVAYKYTNISKEAISGISSGIEIKLISPEGTEYDPDVAGSMGYAAEVGGNEKVLSDLNPGITVKGGMVFEVAKDKLKGDSWSLNVEGKKVVFSL